MCTSFTYQTPEGPNMLARTMDFSFELDPDVVLVPRNYSWRAGPDEKMYKTKYAFTGLGRFQEEYIFADGINDRGLCCAVLYFPGYASYHDTISEGMLNLAPHEVVFWLLSSFASVDEVREALPKLNIIDMQVKMLGLTPPFHWIITDKTGACIVIEPLEDGLKIYDNPVGVMSNSPDLNWHLTNIRNYIGVRPNQLKPITLGGHSFAPFSQGSGTFGLPGDYTPPSRFLRVLFGKEALKHPRTETETLTAAFHILASVDIPKGSVMTDRKVPDYTQYSSAMFCDTCTYYFKTYNNSQICKISLYDNDRNAPDAKIWKLPRSQQFETIRMV